MYLRYIENNDRYIENNNNKNNIFEFYARIICIHIQIYFAKIITKDNKRKKIKDFYIFYISNKITLINSIYNFVYT